MLYDEKLFELGFHLADKLQYFNAIFKKNPLNKFLQFLKFNLNPVLLCPLEQNILSNLHKLPIALIFDQLKQQFNIRQ